MQPSQLPAFLDWTSALAWAASLSLLSLALRLFPRVLWGRGQQQKGLLHSPSPLFPAGGPRPRVVAAGGGRGEAPEGTIAACLASLLGGAHWLRLDASLLRDGTVVSVLNDSANFFRLTGASLDETPLHHLDRPDLPSLRAIIPPPPGLLARAANAGVEAVATAGWGPTGSSIAPLDRIFQLIPPTVPIILDIREGDARRAAALADLVGELVERHGREATTVYGRQLAVAASSIHSSPVRGGEDDDAGEGKEGEKGTERVQARDTGKGGSGAGEGAGEGAGAGDGEGEGEGKGKNRTCTHRHPPQGKNKGKRKKGRTLEQQPPLGEGEGKEQGVRSRTPREQQPPPRICSARSAAAAYALHALGVLPCLPLRWVFGRFWARTVFCVPRLPSIVGDGVREGGGEGGGYFWGLLRRGLRRAAWQTSMFTHLQARGMPTLVEDVNDMGRYVSASDDRTSGISLIQTDLPMQMGLWREERQGDTH